MVEVYLRRIRRGLVFVATLGLCLVSFASLPDGTRIEVAAALEDGFYALAEQQIRSNMLDKPGDMDLKIVCWRMPFGVKGVFRQCLMKFRIILTMSVCVIGWRAHRWIWGTLRRVCCFWREISRLD